VFSRTDFDEDTAFERFVLDRLGTHRVRPLEPSSIHDLRSNAIAIKLGSAIEGAAGREQLRRDLEPLSFGAAFKVLDLLVEHVIRDNVQSAPAKITFRWKQNWLAKGRPKRLPAPLRQRPALWDRLVALYVELDEVRHAVVHRRARITNTGALEAYENNRQLVATLTREEVAAFIGAIHACAELVIGGKDDKRRAGMVGAYLNRLQHVHKRRRLARGSTDGVARLMIMDLVERPNGQLGLDVASAEAAVAGQTPSLWNLDLRAVAVRRRFVAYWEEIPRGGPLLEFDPDLPPRWLREADPIDD
jgi:hypothetical protein